MKTRTPKITWKKDRHGILNLYVGGVNRAYIAGKRGGRYEAAFKHHDGEWMALTPSRDSWLWPNLRAAKRAALQTVNIEL